MSAPTPLLLLNAFVAGSVLIVVLYTLAVFVRCSIELHQLKVETHRLRIQYFHRVAALRNGGEAEIVEVDIIDEPDAGAAIEAEVPGAAQRAAA